MQGKVVFNKRVGPGCFKMAIYAPGIARQAKPGQFVHLRCSDRLAPLLRRPFSFHRLNDKSFEILYQVAGEGTNLLTKKVEADTVDVLGPLGKGFDCEQTIGNAQRTIILVAGGIGVAPLFSLAQALASASASTPGRLQHNKILVLLGAPNKNRLLCVNEFKELGVKVQLATDDGSRGYKGFVTQLLKENLTLPRPLQCKGRGLPQRRINHQQSSIYACGPKPMLKEMADISLRLRIPAYASFEENMACGVGACLGCAIKTKAGYKMVCKDGPIFDLKEIEW